MNDRQFAAAHDRYLEPPDEEFDDTTDDEMDLADIERQNQIDEEDEAEYQSDIQAAAGGLSQTPL